MPAAHRKILGVGLSIVDNLILVPEFPGGEGHLDCLDYLSQGGGMVGTALCAAARLGAAAEIWCRVGDDPEGQRILRDLAAEGIDISQCRIEPGARSGVCTVLVKAATGERTFIYRRATHGSEATPLPDLRRIDQAAVLLVDGHWREAALAALRRARACGVPVVADFTHRVPNPQELLRWVDMPVLPAYAAGVITGGDSPAAAVRLLAERGARLAVVTLGDRGSVYWWEGAVHHCPAFPTAVIDTTGAGDCFHGALCVAIAEGMNMHRALRFASAAAALNCRRLGGRGALPTRAEVFALLGAE